MVHGTDCTGVQNPIADLHSAPVDGHGAPTAELGPSIRGEKDLKDEKDLYGHADGDVEVTAAPYQISDDLIPTEEDLLTLRKVPANMTYVPPCAGAIAHLVFEANAWQFCRLGDVFDRVL